MQFALCHRRHRIPVILLFRQHDPEATVHPLPGNTCKACVSIRIGQAGFCVHFLWSRSSALAMTISFRKRGDRTHARHGLCAAHLSGFLGGASHPHVKLCNTRIQTLNLFQIHSAKFSNLVMPHDVIICDCLRELLEMGRPSGCCDTNASN